MGHVGRNLNLKDLKDLIPEYELVFEPCRIYRMKTEGERGIERGGVRETERHRDRATERHSDRATTKINNDRHRQNSCRQ